MLILVLIMNVAVNCQQCGNVMWTCVINVQFGIVFCLKDASLSLLDNLMSNVYRVRQKKVIPCRILQIFKQPLRIF